MEKDILEHGLNLNRRRFLSRLSLGLGSVALGSLLIPDLLNGSKGESEADFIPGIPNFAPKAKRVIYLFQNGAPSQLESFDYKPKLREMMGQELPASVRMGQRLTGTTNSGKIYRAWMDVKAIFTGNNRRTVLANCEFGEDAAQKAYNMALESDKLPDYLMEIITKQQLDLKAAHDEVKAFRNQES